MKTDNRSMRLKHKADSFVFKFRHLLKTMTDPSISEARESLRKSMSLLITQIGKAFSSAEPLCALAHFTAAKGTAESIAFCMESLTDNEHIAIGDNVELNELLGEIDSEIAAMIRVTTAGREPLQRGRYDE